MEKQIAVEHAKFAFISAVDVRVMPRPWLRPLEQVAALSADRQALITEGSGQLRSGGRGACRRLKADPYTTVLAEIASQLDDPAYMADLSAKMLAARGTQPGGQFFGDGKIVTALQTADAEIDAPPSVPSTKGYATERGHTTGRSKYRCSRSEWRCPVLSTKNGAGPKYGMVSFDQANGTFTYTPAANVNGSDTSPLSSLTERAVTLSRWSA